MGLSEIQSKKRDVIVILCIEIFVALTGFSVALKAYLISSNIKAGAFWSYIAIFIACSCFIVGLNVQHHCKIWLLIGMVINVIGILMCFIGTLLDGAQAGHLSQTRFNECQYSSSNIEKVACFEQSPSSISQNCQMTVHKNSCYCCYIYRENHCDSWVFSLSTQANIFQGVSSCSQVENEYQWLLWASMGCNLLEFVIGAVSLSLIGRYRSAISNSASPNTIHMVVTPQAATDTTTEESFQRPVIIINQQSVGLLPRDITKPPDYDEDINAAPLPIQPGSRRNSLAMIQSGNRRNSTLTTSSIEVVAADTSSSTTNPTLTDNTMETFNVLHLEECDIRRFTSPPPVYNEKWRRKIRGSRSFSNTLPLYNESESSCSYINLRESRSFSNTLPVCSENDNIENSRVNTTLFEVLPACTENEATERVHFSLGQNEDNEIFDRWQTSNLRTGRRHTVTVNSYDDVPPSITREFSLPPPYSP